MRDEGKTAVGAALADAWSRLASLLDPRAWAYVLAPGRDKRLDFIRGFFVLAMVVDHIGGNSWLNAITGNNSFFVSAAEGFVFLSGVLVGIVYGKRALKFGLRVGVEDLLRRVVFLYVVVTLLTLASVAIYLFTEFPLYYDRSWGLGIDDRLEVLVSTLTMHYSYNGTDVLALYVQLMALAPLSLYLLITGRTRYLLGFSWGLWVIYQFFPGRAELLWTVHNSIFPFATWQLVFNNGMALGFHRDRLGRLSATIAQAPVMLSLAAAALAIVLSARAYNTGEWVQLGLPALEQEQWTFLFDKSSLGPGRVVTFLVFAALIHQVVTRAWLPLRLAAGWFLIPLGQSALVAYGAHLFLVGPVQIAFLEILYGSANSPLSAFLVQALAVGTLLALLKVHVLGADATLRATLAGFNRRLAFGPLWRRYVLAPRPHETESRSQ